MARTQKPAIDIPGLNRKDIAIPGLHCRHCQFFEKIGLYEYAKDKDRERTPCTNLGVQPNSKPCPNFAVDPYQFDFGEVDGSTVLLSTLLRELDDKQLPKFAAHLVELYKTRKKGYRFGETVYIRMFGDDYLSNYAAARVIKVKEVVERLVQTSSLDPQIGRRHVRDKHLVVFLQGHGNMRMQLHETSVYKEKEFLARMKDLQKTGRLVDPQYSRYTQMPVPTQLEDPTYRPKLAQVIQFGKRKIITAKGRPKAVKPTSLPSGRALRQYEAQRFATDTVKTYRVVGRK